MYCTKQRFLQLWNDVVSTTYFLITRMLSNMSGGYEPYIILLKIGLYFWSNQRCLETFFMFEMFNHLLPNWIPRPWCVVSCDINIFKKGILVTLLNLENIWCHLIFPFQRLNHSSIHLTFF